MRFSKKLIFPIVIFVATFAITFSQINIPSADRIVRSDYKVMDGQGTGVLVEPLAESVFEVNAKVEPQKPQREVEYLQQDIEKVEHVQKFQDIQNKTFYFSSTTNIQNASLEIEYDDGLIKKDKILLADGGLDGSNLSTNLSSIYEGENIKELRLIGDNLSDVQINYLETENLESARFGIPQMEFEREYKERLFAALGFNLVTREEWGAPTYSEWGPSIVKTDKIVVHHTATSVNSEDPAATVRAIYNEHKVRCSDNNGSYPGNCNIDFTWSDIGYNYLIDPYGNVYEGRAGGNGVIAAHSPPNGNTIGIALLGDFRFVSPSSSAVNTLTKLIGALSLMNQFDVVWQTSLFGHRDRQATECPGEKVYSILPTIAQNAMTIRSSMSSIINAVDTATNQLLGNEYITDSSSTQIVVSKSGLDDPIKLKLDTLSRGVYRVYPSDNSVKYLILNDLRHQFLVQTYLVVPNVIIGPNYWVEAPEVGI